MKNTVLASATMTRSCPTLAREYAASAASITITAQAYFCGGNKHPHFSVTADIINPKASGHNRDIAGGCLHAEAAKYWPAIQPIIALHLANAGDGVPMHAEANGWYFLAGAIPGFAGEQYHGGGGSSAKSPEDCIAIFADMFRISVESARAIRDRFAEMLTASPDSIKFPKQCAKAKRQFSVFVSEQKPRWKAEAEAGLALLKSLSNS